MKTGTASGWQLAFLTFALLLLVVPLNKYLTPVIGLSGPWAELFARSLPFVIYFMVLAAVPHWRVYALRDLSIPIPGDKTAEVALVAIWKLSIAFAFAGGLALWHWSSQGSTGLETGLRLNQIHEESATAAFSIPGVVGTILMATLIGPIAEELVFRGLLYRAWERQYGWVVSMILTSTVFALYHSHFIPSFLGSIVYVCIYRRTGTLRAAIYVHSVFNLALWYPLLGQFMFPSPNRAGGDLWTWNLQIGALILVIVTLPIYIFMARNKREPAPEGA